MMETDLKYFLAVVDTGSYGRAAEKLDLTQPAISKGIQRLEQRLKIRLFERGPRGVRMTSAGVHFADHARVILRNIAHAESEMTMLRGHAEGTIRLGVSPFMAERIVPRAAAMLLKQHGDVTLQVIDDVNIRLIDSLRRGEMDLAFCGIPSQDMLQDIRCRILANDRLGLLVRKGHPLAEMQNPGPDDLTGWPWALHGREVLSRRWLEKQFNRLSIKAPRVSVESNSISHIVALVEESDCITFLPWAVVSTQPSEKRLQRLAIPELTWSHEIGGLFRSDVVLPALWSHFIELVRACLSDLEDIAAVYPNEKGELRSVFDLDRI